MSRYTFADHLAMLVARRWSNETGKPFIAVAGSFTGYDVASLDLVTRIEIKYETTPIRTGNICLEYWSLDYDRASGVLGSEATIWLHFVLEESGVTGYEFDIDTLRKLAIERGVPKSNGRNALCKIIPLSDAKGIARRTIYLDPRLLPGGSIA